jgi:hypothetical protein
LFFVFLCNFLLFLFWIFLSNYWLFICFPLFSIISLSNSCNQLRSLSAKLCFIFHCLEVLSRTQDGFFQSNDFDNNLGLKSLYFKGVCIHGDHWGIGWL